MLAARFGKETHTHRGRNSRLAHRARQDSGSLPASQNATLWGTIRVVTQWVIRHRRKRGE
ncbi:MAG: hypothetical protein J5841_07905 [Clostridia bacterium]|nr:hypothetical protein [Clostridia bacterium]